MNASGSSDWGLTAREYTEWTVPEWSNRNRFSNRANISQVKRSRWWRRESHLRHRRRTCSQNVCSER
jgi:hypothetical protein